jgi:nucleoside-diphosphate-sugar epimerase
LSDDGPQIKAIRKRVLPIVGDGGGVWSFVHVADAAEAVVAALTGGQGVYNIVDDDPAPVREWLPYLASVVDAKPPSRVPVWLARLIGGPGAVYLMTQVRGGSNARAKQELQWAPAHPSWRDGFREDFAS